MKDVHWVGLMEDFREYMEVQQKFVHTHYALERVNIALYPKGQGQDAILMIANDETIEQILEKYKKTEKTSELELTYIIITFTKNNRVKT